MKCSDGIRDCAINVDKMNQICAAQTQAVYSSERGDSAQRLRRLADAVASELIQLQYLHCKQLPKSKRFGNFNLSYIFVSVFSVESENT